MEDTRDELKPVNIPNVSDVILEQLRQHIVQGKFSPGDQLNLNQLEQQLNVSRTPLKTALFRLENEGLVVIHARKGTFIAQLGASDIEECFEVRMALEAQALRHAFEEHNQARIHKLIELLTKMDNYLSDPESWLDEVVTYMDFDRRVHMSIIELSGNQRMKDFYEQINIQGFITVMRTRFTFEDTQEAKVEHRNIRQALKNRDSDLLNEAVYAHLKNGARRALLRLSRFEKQD